MTIKELCEILEKLPPDMEVYYSGINWQEDEFSAAFDLELLHIVENKLFMTGWEQGSVSVEEYLLQL